MTVLGPSPRDGRHTFAPSTPLPSAFRLPRSHPESNMRKFPSLWLSSLLLGALGVVSVAQIKSFTLEEMVQTADQAVYGQIIGSRVFRADSATDGSEHYFTTITVQGRTLRDAQPTTVDITFRGGFLNATEG